MAGCRVGEPRRSEAGVVQEASDPAADVITTVRRGLARSPPGNDRAAVSGVDVTREVGVVLVVTASGARHLIEVHDLDASATVTRLPPETDAEPCYRWADLRRPQEQIALFDVGHVTADGEIEPGLLIDAAAVFFLEPLSPTAYQTVRLTTPVRSITRLDPVTRERSEIDGPSTEEKSEGA